MVSVPQVLLADIGPHCLGALNFYVDAHKPSLGDKRAKLSLQYSSKIKLLLKYSIHIAVYEFIWCKTECCPHFLLSHQAVFNYFQDWIFHTFWKRLNILLYPVGVSNHRILLEMVHLKKNRTNAAIYSKLFMDIQVRRLYSCLCKWFTEWELCGLC